MKIISKISKFVPMLVLVFLFTAACSSDDDNNGGGGSDEGNIVEVALDDPQLSILVQALQRTGLTAVLEGDGPFTVLAPTDAAFTIFLNGASINDVPLDDLAAILLNHVIAGDFKASDLVGLGEGYVPGSSPNDQGQNISIYFNTSNGVQFNGIASVENGGADIDATNGVIHKINRVLDLPDIASHAIANPNLTELVAALGRAGLVGAVEGDDILTVLAPDNDAFADFLDGSEISDVDVDVLTNLLLNHVLAGAITSDALVNLGEGYSNTLAVNADDDNLSLYFNTSNGVTFNGVSSVSTADVIATNGVIHITDAVIGLPTIATFATSNPALSGLVAALLRADEGDNIINWIPAVSDPELLFTVFAPADPAFNVLLQDLGVESLADVDPADVDGLIRLHVVNGANVRSTDLGDLNGVIPTIGGDLSLNGTVITDGDGNTINILVPNLVDIQAINGVVHAVDYVIRAAVD